MSEKEFDRGKCFTFFASYRKQGERIKEILGPEKALEYLEKNEMVLISKGSIECLGLHMPQ